MKYLHAEKKTTKTNLSCLAGFRWFKLEVAGFSLSLSLAGLVLAGWSAGLPAWIRW